MVKIAPSLLSADPDKLLDEVKSISSADYLHIDVMDGDFVSQKTHFLDPSYTKKLKKSDIPLIVHLMVQHPENHIEAFANAGATIIAIHVEAQTDTKNALELIREHGARPSIALNPITPVEAVIPFLNMVDNVLVMSVVPGKGGQAYIDSATDKIKQLKTYRAEHKLHFTIEVDGGIKIENAHIPINAGADIIVSGTGIFSHHNRNEIIEKLKDTLLIASDHAGFSYKEQIKQLLHENKIAYEDYGTSSDESVDYPDYAQKVAQKISNATHSKGILICGSGIGMSMAANRYKNVRAALCTTENQAKLAREHNDANILCMGSRIISFDDAQNITNTWLDTAFSNEERHKRRIEKLK